MFNKRYIGYDQLDHEQEDIESPPEMSINMSQYNFVPQHGMAPGPGLNYIIGIDGHKTLVPRNHLSKPSSVFGTLFCPCFSTGESLPDESKSRCRRCLLSFTFFLCLGQLVVLALMLKHSFAPISENPSFGPTYATMLKFGAKSEPLMVQHNQVWRFFSSTFLYSGILHAVVNMIVQFRLGMFLEREWGWVWFLTTYITAGLGGTLASCVVEPQEIGVGATGAVAGLVTAFGVQVLLCYKILDPFQRRLQGIQFAIFFAIVLLLILCPLVNWSNVVGGCFVGLLIGVVIWAVEESHRVWVIPAFFLLASFAGGFCYLYLYMK